MASENSAGGRKYEHVTGNIVESSGTSNIVAGGNISIGGSVFNQINDRYGRETAKTLANVEQLIQNSRNQAAGQLFDSFTNELKQPKPDKSKLKSFWSSIEKALPAVNTIVGVAAKIVPLFI